MGAAQPAALRDSSVAKRSLRMTRRVTPILNFRQPSTLFYIIYVRTSKHKSLSKLPLSSIALFSAPQRLSAKTSLLFLPRLPCIPWAHLSRAPRGETFLQSSSVPLLSLRGDKRQKCLTDQTGDLYSSKPLLDNPPLHRKNKN